MTNRDRNFKVTIVVYDNSDADQFFAPALLPLIVLFIYLFIPCFF